MSLPFILQQTGRTRHNRKTSKNDECALVEQNNIVPFQVTFFTAALGLIRQKQNN